jgi:hypothetical protein
MKKINALGLKSMTWYAIIALFLCVAVLPILKAAAPEYFPSMDGFRDVDCLGKSCPEGQFCQKNQCVNIATRYPNAVPSGDVM